MTTYVPPLRDLQFVLEDVLDLPRAWAGMPAFADLDADTARQVVEEAGRFASEVLAPLNAPGDLQGCRWTAGEVRTPDGFPEAYRAFVEGGWPALACDPAVGGQGLPNVLNGALFEMICAANHAWTMYPGLLHGAYACLHAHASPDLKAAYLPRLVSGEWLGTMCLTEPQAGSDLGLLRARAEPAADGSFRVTGSKIFISGGEHDLTDNIVHLVLARLPDAPAGSRGISLFLAPKVLPDGARNAVFCDGIEKKMGIKGSATCQMRFEAAQAWLVGEPHRGLAAMFVMMNAARLHVALQGLAHAEAAHARALRYATERVQSRAPRRAAGAGAADPLVAHPAMRRTLLAQRAQVEGGRVLAYWMAHVLDEAEQHPDAAVREAAEARVSLLTPVLKAFLTEMGWRVASDALQVFGGYGYVHEYGAEQTLRDARIPLIYEGTNEIQAIDFVQRKVVADGGARLFGLLDEIDALCAADPGPYGRSLADAVAALRASTASVLALAAQDPEYPLRVADDLLRATGVVLLGYAWLRSAQAAARAAQQRSDDAFLAAKADTAAYFFAYLLPEGELHLARVRAGRGSLPAIAPVGG